MKFNQEPEPKTPNSVAPGVAPEDPTSHGRSVILPAHVHEVDGELLSVLPEGMKADKFLEMRKHRVS